MSGRSPSTLTITTCSTDGLACCADRSQPTAKTTTAIRQTTLRIRPAFVDGMGKRIHLPVSPRTHFAPRPPKEQQGAPMPSSRREKSPPSRNRREGNPPGEKKLPRRTDSAKPQMLNQPKSPFPPQKQSKPGLESRLNPR